jgi:hypothetical protein
LGSILSLKAVVKERLVTAQNIVEKRPQHAAVTSLKLTLSVAVKEPGHNSGLCSWPPFLEIVGEIFCKGALAAARFSLYK